MKLREITVFSALKIEGERKRERKTENENFIKNIELMIKLFSDFFCFHPKILDLAIFYSTLYIRKSSVVFLIQEVDLF